MHNHRPLNQLRLCSYYQFYLSTAPKKNTNYDYQVHSSVGSLISIQLEDIDCIDDIKELCLDLIQIIHEVETLFNINKESFNDYNFPHFIRILENTTVYTPLVKYNSLVIELLKLMLIRIKCSNSKELITNKFNSSLRKLINKYAPPKKLEPFFNDKVNSRDISDISDISDIINQLVDIPLDR